MDTDSEKVGIYHAIYSQLYENPFISLLQIAENTHMPVHMVSHLLDEMYSNYILIGPQISLKPAKNYPLYVYFLKVVYPLWVFKAVSEPHVCTAAIGRGDWDITVISYAEIEVAKIPGVIHCVYQGKKGVTFFSQVTEVEWKQSIPQMLQNIAAPDKKTTVYEIIPELPWGKKEFELFEKFKLNVRLDLKTGKKGITPEKYTEWGSHLQEYTMVQPAFFPQGRAAYIVWDFLFCSQYQRQLTDILSFLPSTAVFFSTGEYVLATLFVAGNVISDLFTVIAHLKKLHYFSEVYHCIHLFRR